MHEDGENGLRLSTTSYVVLGLVALRGPSTPYDLKRAIGRSVGYFWSFPHAQLYSEPDRLTSAGLLTRESESHGRRRKTYTLTRTGQAALREWLAAPTDVHFEMRDEAELKLFFSEAGDPADVSRLAAEQIRQHERRIGVYDAIVASHADSDWAASRLVTVELGLEMEHAALRFWSAVATDDLHGLRARRERARDGVDGASPAGQAT